MSTTVKAGTVKVASRPSNIKTLKVLVHGLSPLLIHSCQGVNPLHPIQKEIKKITSKRTKTEDDLFELGRLEYGISIYHPDKLTILDDVMIETPGQIGPYIPAENIEACIRDGAKKNKKGKDAESAILVNPAMIPILYDGPRDLKSLVNDPNFVDVRVVVVKSGSSGSKVIRTRPRFNNWSLEFEVEYMSDILNKDQVMEALVQAGQLKGLGDFRPKYGRFSVMEI